MKEEDGGAQSRERLFDGDSKVSNTSRLQSVSGYRRRCAAPLTTDVNSQRVFKKSSPNNKLTIYLNSRDLYTADQKIDRLQGVLYVDPEYLEDKKIYGQITLTFRYGREDEEVMGLKFCNEAIMSLAQLFPPHEKAVQETPTPLQEVLLKRLGPNAHPFSMTVTHLAPPSVQLVPAKEYNGAPIGTSYDIRAYIADSPDEKLHRRSTVRMGIRVLQKASQNSSLTDCTKTSNGSQKLSEPKMEPPHALVEKPFLLSDGKVELEASLDKAFYYHGESVGVTVLVRNNSKKTVRRIKVFIVQHVDVCMFSNGKFKNVVALINSKDECPLPPWTSLNQTYILHPAKGATKNWIALEDSFNKSAAVLASTVTCPSSDPEGRNVFAIYVSYYVKVKILVSAMGGELSLKLPFTLTHGLKEQERMVAEPKQEQLEVKSEEPEQTMKDMKNIHNVGGAFETNCRRSRNVAMQDENDIVKCEEEDEGPI